MISFIWIHDILLLHILFKIWHIRASIILCVNFIEIYGIFIILLGYNFYSADGLSEVEMFHEIYKFE